MRVIPSLLSGQALSEAKDLTLRTHRSFASLRMTRRTPLKSAHGKSSLQMSANMANLLTKLNLHIKISIKLSIKISLHSGGFDEASTEINCPGYSTGQSLFRPSANLRGSVDESPGIESTFWPKFSVDHQCCRGVARGRDRYRSGHRGIAGRATSFYSINQSTLWILYRCGDW